MADTTRAAIYCRVSSRGQEEGTSLDSQEAACRQFAAAHGFTVAEVYREVHTGAELWERRELTKLRESVRAGEVGAIVAYALDRLGREQAHLYILDEECERAGVRLLFVTEEFDKTPVGKMIRSVKSFATEIEREKIRERSVRGKRAYAERGLLHNSSTPLYGYHRDREKRVRTINEPEAAVVRAIFRWYGEEGESLNGIMRRLEAQGIPSPAHGKRENSDKAHWGRPQLHRLLTNPAYKGETYAFRWKFEDKRTVRRDREEWVRLPDGVTPPIVSAALWEAVQVRLASNVGDVTRNQRRFYLLRGLVTCARCGYRLVPETTKGHTYYRCASRNAHQGACGAPAIRADALEAAVWAHTEAILNDPAIITREYERTRDAGPDPVLVADRDRLRERVQRLNAGNARLLRQLRNAADDDDAAPIEKEIAAVGRERRDVERALAEIDRRLAVHEREIADLATVADFCRQVAANLAAFGDAERRLALEALNIRVQCDGRDRATWQIAGRIPLTPGNVSPYSGACRCRTWAGRGAGRW